MKKIISITILFLILISILSLLYINFFKKDITGKVINEYSYTKAICNETNYCQDYEIVCKNGEVISKNLITGAAIQFSTNWKDPRDNKAINKLCGR
jgi:hypothetical protein